MTQAINDSFIAQMSGPFVTRNDALNRWGNLVSSYLMLPDLVSFWPMSSKSPTTGNAHDVSGRGGSLTYNGNPVYNTQNLIPYIDFDGTGDSLSRNDESDLDITGIESNTGNPGLTIGGWFFPEGNSSDAGLIGKSIAQYQLTHHNAGDAYFYINGGGNAISQALQNNQWSFVVGRFIAGISLKIWINNITAEKTTSLPASVPDTANAFQIGNASTYFNGRASLCFLCGGAVPDSIIFALYEQGKILFGQ